MCQWIISCYHLHREILKADATDFNSRKEFAEFKANVLNYTCIQELTLEKDKQAKQIQYQKKAILVLKRLLAKNDEASTILNHEKSAIISNQSLPQEPTKSSKLIPLMSQPQGKTAVTKRRMRALPENVIAFYAYLTNAEKKPGAHHIIVYDHVTTNSGNGYSKYTGAFTAPTQGMYVFSWTTFADPHSYFPIELTHNNSRADIIYVDAGGTPNGVTGLAVIQVQQGDVVMLRSSPGFNPRGNIYSDNNMKTSFSGWCILC